MATLAPTQTTPVTSALAGLPDRAPTAAPLEDANSSADRFLKLLVAQMQNQDPLNPMDNAQVTSQMAQINTVNGIEKLNTSVQGLSSQFMQMQAMQGTALVGRDVVVPGNRFAMNEQTGKAGFELAAGANAVKVEVLSSSGTVLDTLNLGARGAGIHHFDWDAANLMAQGVDPATVRFRVISTTGGVNNEAVALMRDRVNAVSTSGKSLNLDLERSGTVAYSAVKAFS